MGSLVGFVMGELSDGQVHPVCATSLMQPVCVESMWPKGPPTLQLH